MIRFLSKIKNAIYPESGWFGNYNSWDEAVKNTSGYDSEVILNKVKNSLFKVKNGEAVYERDSVLFYEKEYNWPMLAMLLQIAIDQNLKLKVLDFGGSLGSLYFQHRELLKNLNEIKWSVVEQKEFVETGKLFFEDEYLKFFFKVEDVIKAINPSVAILSSVLPYIKDPYETLNTILNFNIPFLIFDKMPFVTGKDRLTIQRVHPSIYRASYPAWFFNYRSFDELLSKNYELVISYNCNIPCTIDAEFRGLFYKRKE